jgi:tetratricopeptide (TPR) repeat protein
MIEHRARMRICANATVFLVVLSTIAACATPDRAVELAPHSPASGNHGMAAVSNFTGPIDLIPQALGPYEWAVSTDSADAQAYFNQGMQLRWAFNVDEAARSFAMARDIDPACAMCFWGEAFALGSFLNGGMSAEKAPYAHAAISTASTLAVSNATPLEQDLIKATIVRYPANYDPVNRRSVDEAFAREMAAVYAKYPNNLDVATVYAVSLFMLEDRRGYRDIDDPDVARLQAVLADVLDEDIRHPGACHLYIHATESSQRPDLALECAAFLADSIPVASHIQHMPSHTWNEVGLWGLSVRTNTVAWQSDQKAKHNQGFSYSPMHNLHMLLYAASYDGQGAVAAQAGKDYRKVTGNSMYEVLTLVRFGRFDEVLANDDRPGDEVAAAMWDFAFGYSSLKMGDFDMAVDIQRKISNFADNTDSMFRFHPAGRVVGTLAQVLAGEIAWSQGDLDTAIAAFEFAVSIEDQLDYDEPEPLPFSARHWLGAALLEAGRYDDAAQVYEAELADHPQNGWSLYGLRAALTAQGLSDPEINVDFAESWARADVWITSSRF